MNLFIENSYFRKKMPFHCTKVDAKIIYRTFAKNNALTFYINLIKL